MTAETTYSCNLCRTPLKLEVPQGEVRKGYGFMWDSTGNSVEINWRWRDCPFHLCVTCISAIAAVQDELKERSCP